MADAPLTRTCNNEACGWTGPTSETVHPKHDPSMLLCPTCRETTEPDEMNVFDWLELEIGGMSCEYHGDPVHTHDAYWMQQQVMRLLKDARKAFPSLAAQPQPQPAQPLTGAPVRHMKLMGYNERIPFSVLNEEWAQNNHGQSLARLQERGGLCPTEALAIIERRKWRAMGADEALHEVLRRVDRITAPSTPTPPEVAP